MSTRILIATVVAVLLAGCAQSATPSSSAAPSASELAAASPSALPSVEPSLTPTPAATPTPTPNPTPSPTPTPAPWLTFKSKAFKYSIKYPPTWFVTPSTPGYTDRLDDGGATAIFLDRDVVRAGSIASVEKTAKNEIAYFKSHYTAKLLSNKKVKVAGWSGRLIKMTGSDDGLETYYQLLLLAKGRVGYFIEWQSVDDDRKADQALFQRIYKTFKPRS